MSLPDRARTAARARQALEQLGAHDSTTLHQLGAAREKVNNLRSIKDPPQAWACVHELEDLVAAIYGRIPAATG